VTDPRTRHGKTRIVSWPKTVPVRQLTGVGNYSGKGGAENARVDNVGVDKSARW